MALKYFSKMKILFDIGHSSSLRIFGWKYRKNIFERFSGVSIKNTIKKQIDELRNKFWIGKNKIA